METGVRIMWPPVRAEVARTGKDTLPLYTQPQAGCQPMRQVVAASGKQRVGAMLRGRTASHLPGRWAAQVLTSHRSSPRNERKKNAGQALGGSIFGGIRFGDCVASVLSLSAIPLIPILAQCFFLLDICSMNERHKESGWVLCGLCNIAETVPNLCQIDAAPLDVDGDLVFF